MTTLLYSNKVLKLIYAEKYDLTVPGTLFVCVN